MDKNDLIIINLANHLMKGYTIHIKLSFVYFITYIYLVF